jgi:hypothetical protein
VTLQITRDVERGAVVIESKPSKEPRTVWPVRAIWAGATALTVFWVGFLGWLVIHLVWYFERLLIHYWAS